MGRTTSFISLKRIGWMAGVAVVAVVLVLPARAVAAQNTLPSHKGVLKKALLKKVQAAAVGNVRPLVCDAGPGEMNAAGPARHVRFFGSRPLVLKPLCGGTPYAGGCAHRYADVDGMDTWSGDHYKLRLHVQWCWNGMSVTSCSRWPEIIYVQRTWEFQGWVGWREIGHTGGSSCGAWVQAHMKSTRPWYFDLHHYPWIEAVGQRDGYFGANAGGN